jgi:hypothetical protein
VQTTLKQRVGSIIFGKLVNPPNYAALYGASFFFFSFAVTIPFRKTFILALI